MEIDQDEEIVKEKDDDSVIQALIAQGKKTDASNRAVQKMITEALDGLAIAITELAEAGTPADSNLGKTISQSLEQLTKTISGQKTDLSPITEANKAILTAIETINKASTKSNSSLLNMVMAMQDQNKELIGALKELKGSDKYEDYLKRTIEAIGKSNEFVTKFKIPDYSKEIALLAEAISARPKEYKIEFYRNYGSGNISSAIIKPA